jgi:hypothetical protein
MSLLGSTIRGRWLALVAASTLASGTANALSTAVRPGSGTMPSVTAPTLPPLAPPEAPFFTVVGTKTSATMTLAWQDASAAEAGYRVERQDGTSWTVVATLAPIGGSLVGQGGLHKVTGLSQNTRYCFRVVPFNSAGAPSPSPVCAATNRVTGPITVVVSDLQGLQGELEDAYSPLAFRGFQLLTPPPPPPFPVPPARKIVYVADGASIRIPPGAKVDLQAGVHLMSGRGGLGRGALLYTDGFVHPESPSRSMIRVVGDGVRISGLRVRGPSAGTDESLGGRIGVEVRGAVDVVIDHNELYQWTEAALRVQHEVGQLQSITAGRMRITENYFHHNQRAGDGYGVVVQRGSYAYIDKNTFDWNRHAIAASGGADAILDPSYGPQKGYLAYLNLVLPGHSPIEYVGGAVDHQTHNFDVHGTEDDWKGVDKYDGWAGEFFDIADNSFLGVRGTVFNIRGTPSAGAYFHHNVAPLGAGGLDGGNYETAPLLGWKLVSEESDRDNVFVYGNIPSADPRNDLGVGDFDGDGRDDVFLATGRAWYVSYGGVTEWRFLQAADLTLVSLSLGDLDGNGRTDVVARIGGVWHASWNGRGALVPIGSAPVLPSQEFYEGGKLVGDFTGDGVPDSLSFDPLADRYFRVVNGSTGAASASRHQM